MYFFWCVVVLAEFDMPCNSTFEIFEEIEIGQNPPNGNLNY